MPQDVVWVGAGFPVDHDTENAVTVEEVVDGDVIGVHHRRPTDRRDGVGSQAGDQQIVVQVADNVSDPVGGRGVRAGSADEYERAHSRSSNECGPVLSSHT